jgi:hypothetical protein
MVQICCRKIFVSVLWANNNLISKKPKGADMSYCWFYFDPLLKVGGLRSKRLWCLEFVFLLVVKKNVKVLFCPLFPDIR